MNKVVFRTGKPYQLKLEEREHLTGLYGRFLKREGGHYFAFVIKEGEEYFQINIDESDIILKGDVISSKRPDLTRRTRCDPDIIGHSHLVNSLESVKTKRERK